MLEKVNIGRILKKLMEHGGEYGDLFYENVHSTRIVHEDNRLEKIVTGTDSGVGIRLIRNHKTFYGWCNSLDEKSLLTIASRIAGLSESERLPLPTVGEKRKIPPVAPVETPPENFEIDRKIKIVLAAREGACIADTVKQVRVNYGDAKRIIQIANSDGDFLENSQNYVLLAVQVVASSNGVLQIGYEAEGGTTGMEIFHHVHPKGVGEKAGERAILMLKAKKAPGGKMPVVLSSMAGGTMIHEAVGHGLEADLATGGLSVYGDKIGAEIASPLVTVVDDPTFPGKRGSYSVDDEGTLTAKTVLVENGQLKNFMFDRLQGLKNNSPSTGNGRRESYRHRPIPRMSNTIIAPGESSPGDIISTVRDGLFVKKMGGGQVNTVTGDFVFEVSEGYLIKRGKVDEPVRGATLTGSGPEVLKMIDQVGNDLGFAIGTCGKDGQGVPVADAQPTIHIGEPYITVGGQAD